MTAATKNIQKIKKQSISQMMTKVNENRVAIHSAGKHEVDLRKNIDEHELSLYNKFIYAYNHFTRKGMVIL